MLLHGIFPPITTPFYPDGRVYLKKLEHNVERYSKTPVAGIVVLGSTGEAIMLSDEERREVLKTARQACAPHKVLIAGTGAESALETLHLTEYAAELGYDVALVRTPFFYRSQIPPPKSATTSSLKTRQKEVGFQILVGAAPKLHPSLEAGAVGAVLAFACPAPTSCYEVYAAWKEGDENLAIVKQDRIVQPAQRVASGLSVPGLKYAMDFNGYYGGPPRLPLLPLTADLKNEVERLMADIRN